MFINKFYTQHKKNGRIAVSVMGKKQNLTKKEFTAIQTAFVVDGQTYRFQDGNVIPSTFVICRKVTDDEKKNAKLRRSIQRQKKGSKSFYFDDRQTDAAH